MPVYDTMCESCGHVEKDVFFRANEFAGGFEQIVCRKCGGSMTKLPAIPNMHLFPIGGIHLEHVCPGGKTFHSKNEMKEYAQKHDLELGALL